jgi:glycosyltransferase involved in cell wall biosynthesis
METRLTISVLIVTRNRAEWLRDTLDSVTRQSRPPDEVIVVDNASTDHTRDVVSSFADRLNVTYVHEPTRGIPHARNAAVRCATGDIVAFVDDDCVADENWLRHIEVAFLRDPNIGAVGGEIGYDRVGDGSVEAFYIANMDLQQRSR